MTLGDDPPGRVHRQALSHGGSGRLGGQSPSPPWPAQRPADLDDDIKAQWPRSPEQLWEELRGAGLTDADTVDMMTWQNASRFFRFDPFRHRSRADATVGALRATATDVDVRVTSRAEYRRRYEAAHGAS